MAELHWFEAYPPRGTGLGDITGMIRVLANRPRLGLRRLQPMVVFELWLSADRVRWLVGTEPTIARTLPSELMAQLPDLVLTAVTEPRRPDLATAREIRTASMVYPLRLDTASAVASGLWGAREHLRGTEALVLQWVVGPGHLSTGYPRTQTPLDLLGFTTPRQPGSDERQAWKHKIGEPLFGVRGRVGVAAGDLRRGGELMRPLVSTLALAGGTRSRLYATRQSTRTARQVGQVMGQARTWSNLVNAGELAALVGWYLSGLDLPGLPGGFAPPPAGLLRRDPTARPLGRSVHPATRGAALAMPAASYAAHCHLIGPTYTGKSTLLAHWILSEAAAGRSVVVIEPKGDLVTDVLARLPQRRLGDVVVIDPGADGSVVGINPLAGKRQDAERRADSLLGLMRSVFGSAIGPRSADVLLHALIMVARLDDGALTDVPVLLTNPVFRRQVAAKVSDPLVIGPWLAYFDNLSEAERGQVVAPIGNKLRPWTSRPALRHLLGQARPKFDLSMVFTRPTVLLVNLNAGVVGPETADLLGGLLLGQLWEAIQRQTSLPAAQRPMVPVVIDEWQRFTTGLDFADVLARSRGANVPVTVAHQHLGQLSSDLEAAVLANAASRVTFRALGGDGRALARVLGAPVTADDLERLPAYHAVARVLAGGAPSRAFEIATAPLPPPTQEPDAVRRASGERFGQDPAAIDAALQARWGGQAPPDAPIGVRRKPS